MVSWAFRPLGFGTTHSNAPASGSGWRPAVAARTPKARRYAVMPATDHVRCVPGDPRGELAAPCRILRRGEFVGAGARPRHQIGDADAAPDEVLPVRIAHASGRVDGPLDDSRPQQGGIEAIPRVGEVRLRRGGPQPRVDPDEQQPQAGGDQIGNDATATGLQFSAGEMGHGRHICTGHAWPARGRAMRR